MAKNWISSPLGLHLTFNVHGIYAKKNFDSVSTVLKSKKAFIIKNKLFLLATDAKQFLAGTKNKLNLDKEIFTSSGESFAAVKHWVNQYGDFQQFNPDKYNFPDAKAILTNICMYKGAWRSSMVKVHNSFSYTEDVKYEVRILVVGTCDDDISLAIVVPNETDVLCNLVKKLQEEGLSAALATIQPAFTATCKQPLPTFQFNSNIDLLDPRDAKNSLSQCGCVNMDPTGIDIKVLTCLVVDKQVKEIISNYPHNSNNGFSFALVCKDVPIFTGQVLP